MSPSGSAPPLAGVKAADAFRGLAFWGEAAAQRFN